MHPDEERGRLTDHFADQQTPLPPHLDWEALGPEIIGAEPPRRRGFLWWLLGAGAGAILLTMTLLSQSSGQETAGHAVGLPPFLADSLTAEAQPEVLSAGTLPEPRAIPSADRQRPAASPARAVSPLKGNFSSPVTGRVMPATVPAIQSLLPTVYREDDSLRLPLMTATPPAPVSGKSVYSYALLGGGAIRPGQLPGPAAQFTVSRPLSDGPLRLAATFTYERLDRRTDSDRTVPVTLYRPGTPDTLFRDLVTGEERLVTTDSVSGMLRRQRRQHVLEERLGGQLTLVRRFSRGRLRIDPGVGLGADFLLRSRGQLPDGTPAPAGFRLAAVGTVSVSYAITDRFDLLWRTEFVRPFGQAEEQRMRMGIGLRYHPGR